jgi:cyclophilin family peptidyl-prolyl cis-trans isomerase
MKRILWLICIITILLFACSAQEQDVCILDTSMGTMVFKFFEGDAPNTCAHFKKLVADGYYDGLPFYRVVKGHVIQAGDSSVNVNAEFNQNSHVEGTVGLARSEDPNSGQAAFYICLAPRPHLDGKYTVFGQLIEGLDVLRAIGNVEVSEKFYGETNIAFHEPKEPVLIQRASIERRRVSDSGGS